MCPGTSGYAPAGWSVRSSPGAAGSALGGYGCSDRWPIPTGGAAMTYLYTRYLADKKAVDDRALNRHVLAQVARLMPPGDPRIIEIGAGLGTMAARLLDWRVISAGEYVLLDVDAQLLRDSRTWLAEWATARGLPTEPMRDGLRVGGLQVRLVRARRRRHLDGGPRRAARH